VERLGVLEAFGLLPLRERLREVVLTFQGDAHTPPSRFDVTSLKIIKPVMSLKAWFGVRPKDKRVEIYNFFNRDLTPAQEGHSVRVTRVRDWRGGALTYDSHNGTDFAVPVGTPVVAAAAGRVLRVSSEFNRGGLKVFIDHGRGLITTSNHLGRALVREGQAVRRGEVVALSGASGVDMVLAFPWNAPHVHFNVWLNGVPVDPFAAAGSQEASLWRSGGDPVPNGVAQVEGAEGADPAEPTETAWEEALIEAALAACKAPEVVKAVEGIPNLARRAMATLFYQNYYPTRFSERVSVYPKARARAPWLDLPFLAADYVGIRY
jgi:murein DD-endopeptidase MepM/ murein hydrolase activator NlpD